MKNKHNTEAIKSTLMASGHVMALDYINDLENHIESLKDRTRDKEMVGSGDIVYRACPLKLNGIFSDEKSIKIEDSKVRVVCGNHEEDYIGDWCSTQEAAVDFAKQDLDEILEDERESEDESQN